jgi:hypothetical protein
MVGMTRETSPWRWLPFAMMLAIFAFSSLPSERALLR